MQPGNSTTLERAHDAGGSARVDRVLIVFHYPGGAEAVPLSRGETLVVGRLAPSDVQLNDASLSRRHASFSWTDEGIVVEDLASTNGTRVAGELVERRAVAPGDAIELGGVTAALVAMGEPPPGLVGHEQLARVLDRELERARHFQRPLAVMFVRGSVPIGRWYARLLPLLRSVDVIGVYSDDAVELGLPELDQQAARRVATRVIAELGEAGTLACGVATFPLAGRSSHELLALARAAADEATSAEPIQCANEGPHELTRDDASDRLVSRSQQMGRVMETALRLARGTIPVLLYGETGTGKELIARFIHQRGPRSDKPLLRVSCAALAPSTLERTLIGNDRDGALEIARGGSLLLDEIGELLPDSQTALLRALETERTDVRMLATTHRDIGELVASGKFREDLYFRLNAMVLKVPPLRQRKEDIVPLAEAFLAAQGAMRIDPEVLELLEVHRWPGNVRELKNAIERAIAIADGDTITLDDLPEALRPAAAGSVVNGEVPNDQELDLRTRLERYELLLIRDALRSTGWNQTQAALKLKMPRRTLVYKIRTYAIRRDDEQ